MRCEQCEVATTNGVRCHETGCPLAWQDEIRECAWCGTDFAPEDRHQRCCEASCEMAYTGGPFDAECPDLGELREGVPEGGPR